MQLPAQFGDQVIRLEISGVRDVCRSRQNRARPTVAGISNLIAGRAASTSALQRLLLSLALLSLVTIIAPSVTSAATPTTMAFPTEATGFSSVLHSRSVTSDYAPARWTTHIVVTSYNSVPEQTDDTPFITASGTHVRDGIVASNYLPIGTQVRFPELYGTKVFIVEDRMNARYFKRADIWSDNIEFSKQFGARYLKMEVL